MTQRQFLLALASFFALFICKFATCEEKILSPRERIVSNNQIFQNLSNLLHGCNLKFFFVQRPSHVLRKQFESFVAVADNKVTVSVLSDLSSFFKHKQTRYNSTCKQTCVVHVYMYQERILKNPQDAFYNTFIINFAANFMTLEIWPHHFLFMTDSIPYFTATEGTERVSKHSQELTVYLRGVVLFIEYRRGTTSLVCYPCLPVSNLVLVRINVNTVESLKQLAGEMNSINFQLRGRHVYLSIDAMVPEVACTMRGLLPKYYYVTSLLPMRKHCVHHALKRYLNYTVTNRRIHNHLYISMEVMVDTWNVKGVLSSDYFGGSAHLAHMEPVIFTSYQKKPEITITFLVKPFTWRIWIIFLTSAVTLGGLTAAIEKVEGLKCGLSSIVMDILASVLAQDVSRNTQKVVDNKPKNMLRNWLLLWMLMLVVLNCAYSGVVYSYFADGIPPEWPRTLMDTLHDPSYLKLTVSAAGIRANNFFSSKIFLFLRNVTFPESKSHVSLQTLRAVKMYCKFRPFDFFFYDITAKDCFTNTIDFSFQRKNSTRYPKLTLIDLVTEASAMNLYIMSMYSDLFVSTQSEKIEGTQLVGVWAVFLNFFTERFSWGLGHLSQAGYYKILNNHVILGYRCNFLVRRLRSLQYKIATIDAALRKCRYMVNTGGDVRLLDNYPKPLSLKQMKAIFFALVRLLIVPTIAMVLEFVWGKLKSQGFTVISLFSYRLWLALLKYTRLKISQLFRKLGFTCGTTLHQFLTCFLICPGKCYEFLRKRKDL